MTTQVTFHVSAPAKNVQQALIAKGHEFEEEDIQESDGMTSITCHDPDRGYWAHNVRAVLVEKFGLDPLDPAEHTWW